MTRSYVTLVDPIQDVIRNVTRHTPLQRVQSEGQEPEVRYVFAPADLPEAYYTLAAYHSLQGLAMDAVRLDRWRLQSPDKAHIPAQVNFFDVVKLDRRCLRDVRLKLKKNGPGMLAGDLLCYGTGMLRARNDDPTELLHERLWEHYGRLHSRHETVFARIRTLHWNTVPVSASPGKESFDSTNMIHADAHGEMLQLWDRRADTAFLDQVARHLQRIRDQAEITAYLHPPLNLTAMMRLHLKAQVVWRQPPTSGRALLRRLEFILNHTVLDEKPHTVFPKTPARNMESHGGWQPDHSGYDGWLRG